MIRKLLSLVVFSSLSILTLNANAQTIDFCNPEFIRGPSDGAATPYPSVINVNGLGGTISDVDVTIYNYFTEEILGTRLLLVGPGGQGVMLMRFVGTDGGGPVTYRFDDEASDTMSFIGFDPSGSYQPTDFGAAPDPPAPAPGGPYAPALDVFDGTDPNGVWSLYLANHDFGNTPASSRIEDGWCLHFSGPTVAVPEPGSVAMLLGLGLSGAGLAVRRRRK